MTESKEAQLTFSKKLKLPIVIIASAFLVYCIYWLIMGIIWGYTLTSNVLNGFLTSVFAQRGNTELVALLIQEYCSVTNSFVLMFCGAFAFQSAIYYVKNSQNYIRKLRYSLVLMAVFSILLIPASMHHLIGVVSGWFMVDAFVGLSYIVQALLIVPPLLILSQKLRSPQNTGSIKKRALIAAPAFVFALYFKYVFLWADTLLPLGPKTSTVASSLGAVNALVTLAVAGVISIAACYAFNKGKRSGNHLAGAALILVGAFFIIYTITAIFEPIYASFWYLTDTWMITLPALGIVLLTGKPAFKPW